MAPNVPDMSAFLNPALCANNKQVDGTTTACQKNAKNACGSCNLVQYCSKQCQFHSGRQPAFISSIPLVSFGTKKYLWGNMPALDILNVKENEGETDVITRDLALLFAASGDLRNVAKSVVGLPETYSGECCVVMNDKEFIIVARNAIMLLVALHLDAEVAVPMIIHLWYSAALPRAMVDVLQSRILVLVEDVCNKIKDKPTRSLQARTFTINGSKLRLVLRKEEWFELATYFTVPKTLTLKVSQMVRRRVTLAPERIDYRERAMLQWPAALREVDMHFRNEGVLLPYGCSLEAFNTPNPTLFQGENWPMKDSSNPREGWQYYEYMKYAPTAKADEHGAIFFYVRDLLLKFCTRLQNAKISIRMFSMDAQDLGQYISDLKFDRIEISNICDRGFLGPHSCIRVFAPLLKQKPDNPKATLLMLFLNAATETENANKSSVNWRIGLEVAMRRLNKYMPLDRAKAAQIQNADDVGRHPDFVRRSSCHDMLKNWEQWFDMFMKDSELVDFANLCGLKIKNKHTIVEPWPCKVGVRTTKEEFDILRASGTTGYERYMEFERRDGVIDGVSFSIH